MEPKKYKPRSTRKPRQKSYIIILLMLVSLLLSFFLGGAFTWLRQPRPESSTITKSEVPSETVKLTFTVPSPTAIESPTVVPTEPDKALPEPTEPIDPLPEPTERPVELTERSLEPTLTPIATLSTTLVIAPTATLVPAETVSIPSETVEPTVEVTSTGKEPDQPTETVEPTVEVTSTGKEPDEPTAIVEPTVEVTSTRKEPDEPTAIVEPTVEITATPIFTETLSIGSPYGPRPTLSPLPSEEGGLIFNGSGDKLLVALTFDAGQRPELPAGYDQEIERVLLETETPATIFLGGDWMRYHPEETKFLYNHPLFELGNHGWAHIDFAQATVEEMLPEIEETQQMMWNLLGFQPTIFRFPFGTYSEEALGVVEEHGLRAIQWDVVSGDPDPNVTAEAMIPWVLKQVEPGSIIIMHMNGRGWNSAEALPTIIETLRTEGYTFVTVSELLGLE